MIPTDDERREVARKLRELHPEDRRWFGIHGFDWFMFADSLFDAIGCNGNRNWTDYLADLIEPPARCLHYMHPCCRTDAGGDYIDRDALLTLVDGLEYRANELIKAAQRAQFSELGPTMEHAKNDAYELRCIANHIRKALGVES